MRSLIVACIIGIWTTTGGAADRAPVVFAAASLKTALDRIASDYLSETGQDITVSYAGSSVLARQIEYGAPADIFVSASADWMDHLANRDLLRTESRIDLASNRLVLIAPIGGTDVIELTPDTDLVGALNSGRLAMALVSAVPAGIYGREAFVALGLWNSVADHVAQTDNVRAALRLVATGAAPLGVVYATDADADPRVQVVAAFDAQLHSPIRYPAALTKRAGSAATDFFVFLTGPAGHAQLSGAGFLLDVNGS
ncbi:MAG: molybdate ABC transporter substrate-binding protein [Pseudomonadota bacterium]